MISKALVTGMYQRKLEELARLPGIELTAIVPAFWRDRRGDVTLEKAYTRGYELVVAPLAFNGQYHLHFYPTLGRLLAGLRPDIVHMDEEPYNLATWHALRLGRAVGAGCLFFTWQNLRRNYPWPFRQMELASYRMAAHAIAGNQAAADGLRAKKYRGRLSIIPQFGVDPDIFSPEVAPRPENRFAIGYSGALIPEKGVDLLLTACAGLPSRGWSLAILGDGPERERLETMAGQLGIGGHVRFLGRLSSIEVPAFYRGLDVLVLPSLTRANWAEQFGRVLIEAMACEVPVVGSSSGEIPHVIADAGVIFPEGEVTALGAALADLMADPARRAQLGARGRTRVLEQYTQARIAAATYRVYREIME
jgi:glycosyltransferase involved in cell wall biosynthesis